MKKKTKKAARKGGRKGPTSKAAGPGDAPSQKSSKAQSQAPNPYEVFQNRRCRNAVLGERVRGQRRNMARSRASAMAERAQGLLKESLTGLRTSSFKDARLGERQKAAGGSGKSKEERTVQRLVKLRQREARKSFTLDGAGTEDLMHGGKPVSALDDDELADGSNASEEEGGEQPTVDDIVGQRIKTRAELAREKEAREQMRKDLDKDYQDILGELSFRKARSEPIPDKSTSAGPDGYDLLLRQLASDRKAVASERTKTPEEIALERAQELEKLERARAARAEAAVTKDPEDEDDGAAAAGENSSFIRLEDAAALVGRDDRLEGGREAGGEQEEEEEEEDEQQQEGEEEEDDGEAEEEGAGGGQAEKAKGAGKTQADEDDEDDRRAGTALHLFSPAETRSINIMANTEGEDGLPYAPDCPTSMRALEALAGSHPPETLFKLVQRIRACTASTLSAGNSAKLQAFLPALLDYTLHLMARSDGDISARGVEAMYALRMPLLELAGAYPDVAVAYFTKRLQSMGPGTVPRAAEFSVLKLITILFPVSDFQHPVTTPASVLADHWAAQIAALGSGLGDLVSDAMFLWEVVYEFVKPTCRFCASFFQLGMALLESCVALAASGREQCIGAAEAIVAVLDEVLRAFLEADFSAARVAAGELVVPGLHRIEAGSLKGSAGERLAERLRGLRDLCSRADAEGPGVVPLALFQAAPAQIRMLDPVFHELGATRSSLKGAEVSETKQLQRRLNKERRAAMRQLSRDATVLQQLQSRKDSELRTTRQRERKRVSGIMDAEAAMLRKMRTENTTGMDTSLHRYSAGKDRKKANQRLGGNTTADSKRERRAKRPAAEAAGGAPGPDQGAAGEGKKKAKKRGGG